MKINNKKDKNKIDIMVVAPGPKFSTYDVFTYYLDGYRTNNDYNNVQPFNFHNGLLYHYHAIKNSFPHYMEEEIANVQYNRAARDLLIDVMMMEPDVVFFIAGTLIPHEIYQHLLWMRQKLDDPFMVATYFTESPYQDEMQEYFVQYADALFINDKYSVDYFDPKHQRYVSYLPHSFNPKVHYPGKFEDGLLTDEYRTDIVFGGTAFKERLDMLASVDWKDSDLKLLGTWCEWNDTESGQKLARYVANSSPIVNNADLSEYYRGTKIALNIHRTNSDVDGSGKDIDNYTGAYSIGPRIYEASACGAFILTDYRKEAEDIFDDTIDFFDNPDQLSEKVAYWLDPEHEQERLNRAEAARLRIQNCKFTDRIDEYLTPVFREILKLRRLKHG